MTKLASAAPAADTETLLWTAGAATENTVNVSFVTRGATSLVRLAIADASSTPDPADFVEWDAEVPPGKPLERTGLSIGSEQRLYVQASTADVSFVVHGVSKSTA